MQSVKMEYFDFRTQLSPLTTDLLTGKNGHLLLTSCRWLRLDSGPGPMKILQIKEGGELEEGDGLKGAT